MIDPLGNEKVFPLLRTAMDAASMRHQVLSANLANIDTPGYKARDLDFEGVLNEFENQQKMMPTQRSDNNRSLPPAQPLNFKDFIDEDESNNLTERFDGNNVDLDKQVANLATTRGRFQLATMFTMGRTRLINEIIQQTR